MKVANLAGLGALLLLSLALPTPLHAALTQALRKFLGSNDMVAYLTMTAVRLVEPQPCKAPDCSVDGVFRIDIPRKPSEWCLYS